VRSSIPPCGPASLPALTGVRKIHRLGLNRFPKRYARCDRPIIFGRGEFAEKLVRVPEVEMPGRVAEGDVKSGDAFQRRNESLVEGSVLGFLRSNVRPMAGTMYSTVQDMN